MMMNCLNVRSALIAGTLAALSFAAPASAQTATETDWSILSPCLVSNTKFDAACAQRVVLEKGFADRNGTVCFLRDSPVTRSQLARFEVQRSLHSFNGRGCTAGRLTYTAALNQCAAQGMRSCQQLVAGGGGTPLQGGTTANSALNQVLGGGTPAQHPAPSVGGVLNDVGKAVDTIGALKGLFN